MADPTVRPISAADITTWDYEADVVVAGYGIAGVTAAIEAARAGAEVLVLERTGGWGGAASLAGGFIYLGGGTPLQKACGFEDSVENMKTFMKAALGPGTDDTKIDAYCEGSVDHYNWLVDAGVPFKESFWGQPGWEPPYDDGLMYSGGENAAPFNTLVDPAPRGHVPQMSEKNTGEKGGGYMLMKPLVETAEKLGVRAEYDLRVQTLVVDGDRVVGVRRQALRQRRRDSRTQGRRAGDGQLRVQQRDGALERTAYLRPPGGLHRGARRPRNPDRSGTRRRHRTHGRHRGRVLLRPAVDGARHSCQRPRSAIHPRGHLPRPRRPGNAVPAGQPGIPRDRRSCVRGRHECRIVQCTVAGAAELGGGDRRGTRRRDGIARRIAAIHRRPLQPARG